MANFMGEIEGLLKEKDQPKDSDKESVGEEASFHQSPAGQSHDIPRIEQSEDKATSVEAPGEAPSPFHLFQGWYAK